jgi:release factor glutamine methyltransferase
MTKEQIKERLQAAKIENAAGEARLLWESFSGEALESAVQRRCTHYPLQYILGEWCFWRESYEVSEHCLVPRPDTEHLVEQAISRLPQDACFLDLCTGSGCVAISVLCSRPDTRAVAVDLFPETLALAERNAVKNGVRERFTPWLCDVLSGGDRTEEFDAILSNPPYIREAAMETLAPEVRHEPAAALLGGKDGMDFYRAILEKWHKHLKKDGFFLFEIGYDQADEIKALAKQHGLDTTVFRDYGGNDRVAFLK